MHFFFSMKFGDLTVSGYVFAVWHFLTSIQCVKVIGRCHLEGRFLIPDVQLN